MTNWVGSSARPWMADRSSLLTRDGKASSRHLGVRRSTRVLTPFQACQSISSHCSPIIDRSTNVSTGAVVQRPRSDAGNSSADSSGGDQRSGSFQSSANATRVIFVLTVPGEIENTQTPWRRVSAASASVKRLMAALLAALSRCA